MVLAPIPPACQTPLKTAFFALAFLSPVPSAKLSRMGDIVIPFTVPELPEDSTANRGENRAADAPESAPAEPAPAVEAPKVEILPNGLPALHPGMKNLKPFQKGKPSANPSGRPKKLPFTDRIAAFAETKLPKEVQQKLGLPKGATWADACVLRQFREAVAHGNTAAFRELRESVEGCTPRRPDLGVGGDGDGRKEIVIRVSYDSTDSVDPETPAEKTPE